MSILDIGPVLFATIEEQIGWFQRKSILAENPQCPVCNNVMLMQVRRDVEDQHRYINTTKMEICQYVTIFLCRWRCHECRKTMSLRQGSFFSKSKLPLQKWLLLMHWWARDYPVTDAAQEAKISKVTAVQVYQYFRDICSWRLLHHDAPLLLGGPGVVVQIDESLFRHKPKVKVEISVEFAKFS